MARRRGDECDLLPKRPRVPASGWAGGCLVAGTAAGVWAATGLDTAGLPVHYVAMAAVVAVLGAVVRLAKAVSQRGGQGTGEAARVAGRRAVLAVCILAGIAGGARGYRVALSTARAGEAIARGSGPFVGTVVSDPSLASRGAKVRVRLEAPRADVALLVEGDPPALGERVEFRGTALGGGGVAEAAGRLDGTAATIVAAPGSVGRMPPSGWLAGLFEWRAVSLERLARLMEDARPRALVAGVTLGYRGWVDEATQGDFRRSGLSHLLAVSGTHVVVVCGLVWGLARACGASARWRRYLAGAALVGFTVMTGLQPSALRAALCWVLAGAGWTLGRRTSRLAALGVAAGALALVDPWIVFTMGFRLSFGAVIALVWWAPAFEARLARFPGWLRQPLAATLAVQAGLLPLLAESFSQVSVIAPLANLAAAPAFPPLLGAGLIGLGAAGTGDGAVSLARACLAVAGVAAGWVATVARIAARPWWAALPTTGLPLAGVPLYLVGTELLVRPRQRSLLGRTGAAGPREARADGRRAGVLAAAVVLAVLLAAFRPVAAGAPGLAQMRVLDVGQGDAILLRTPAGHDVLVDGGPSGSAVKHALARAGVGHLDLAVVTHPHADHYKGMLAVLSDLSVDELWESPAAVPDAGYGRMLAAARARGVPIRAPPPGTVRAVDRWLTLDVLGPPNVPDAARAEVGANDASLVLMARFGRRRFLLSGDVSSVAQAALVGRVGRPALACDVYKVAHHGSAGSLDGTFLDALGTPLVVIPVGRPNRYGHPSRAALAEFVSRGWAIHRTDDHGEVVVSTDGTRLWVRREKDCLPRSR